MRRTTTPGAGSGRPARHTRDEGCLGRPREPLPTRVEGLPALPPAWHVSLDAGLGHLGLELGRDARAAIETHLRLLLAWNVAINLTAIRDPVETATRHVVDSLAAATLFRERRLQAFLDLGSGGGFPGLPLAAALTGTRALLVDSTAKKAAFLSAAAAAAGLSDRLAVVAARAEELARDPRHREAWPAVTARAVAPLDELVELAFPLLVVGGRLVAWKAGDLGHEVAAGQRAIAGLGGGSIARHEVTVRGLTGHVLLEVTKRGRTPAGFPRDRAIRRRRPW